MDHVTEAQDSPPSENPHGAAADAAVTYLSPKQVAAMWGTSHDKVLAFIHTGELQAFNVASRPTGRPRFRITLAAVKAFEELRSGHDPSQTAKITPRRSPRSVLPAPKKKYF